MTVSHRFFRDAAEPLLRLVPSADDGRQLATICENEDVVRALESAFDGERVRAANGFTRLFVHPERYIKTVDGLITGLHDPQATHLAMLHAKFGI